MKRTLIFICLFGTLLSYSFGVEAKKKEIAFQMYSVRDLIGNPNKYAQNHESTLKALAKMGYTAIEAANYDNGKLYGVTPEQFRQTSRLQAWKFFRAMSVIILTTRN
jgi:hypothetical protein